MNPMKSATMQGYKANLQNEIPIGAVIVKDGEIISKAYNNREKSQIATHHAEILAIEKACKKLKSWRLGDCDLYVTKEPCPMCAGAIMNARIRKVVYAVQDFENGGISKFDILNNSMNHCAEFEHDTTFEEENKLLLQNFFKGKRKNNKN